MFELSLYEHFASSSNRSLSVFADVQSWPLGEKPRLLSQKYPTTKLAFNDLSRANLTVAPTEDGCQLELRHELIANENDALNWQEYWKQLFSEMHKRLDV